MPNFLDSPMQLKDICCGHDSSAGQDPHTVWNGTFQMSAALFWDGKPIGAVKNDGKGGAHLFYITGAGGGDRARERAFILMDRFCQTRRPRLYRDQLGKVIQLPWNPDELVNEQFMVYIQERDLKHDMRRNWIFTRPNNWDLFTWSKKTVSTATIYAQQAKHEVIHILNDMKPESALRLMLDFEQADLEDQFRAQNNGADP